MFDVAFKGMIDLNKRMRVAIFIGGAARNKGNRILAGTRVLLEIPPFKAPIFQMNTPKNIDYGAGLGEGVVIVLRLVAIASESTAPVIASIFCLEIVVPFARKKSIPHANFPSKTSNSAF